MPSLADFVIDRSEVPMYNDRLNREFPRLADVMAVDKRSLTWPGGGQSEFFPRDELYNPYLGKDAVEIYNPQQKGRSLRDLLFGERLHKQGDAWIGDPEWIKRKAQFYNLLPDGDKALLRDNYARAQNERGEHRSYEDWLNQSALDQWISALFNSADMVNPEHRKEWQAVQWSPEILQWREEADRYLRGQ